jgi:1,4-alpha-glucan branching enzyme
VACKTKKKSTIKKKKTTKAKRKVIISTEFSFFAPDAKEIFLAGDFNDWDTGKHSMRKYKGNIFKKKLKLKPGRYEYLFVVDGQWQTDPQNSERQANVFGSENSVVTISDDVIQFR